MAIGMRFTAHSNLFLFNVKRKSILLSMLSWVCIHSCLGERPLFTRTFACSFLIEISRPSAFLCTHLAIAERMDKTFLYITLTLESAFMCLTYCPVPMTTVWCTLIGVACHNCHTRVFVGIDSRPRCTFFLKRQLAHYVVLAVLTIPPIIIHNVR